MTQLLVNTLRDNPAEAEVVSHQLLVRAGYIRRVASGIYNYLPLMWRVMKKIETIVREEMDRAGAQELLMPILQPAELWQESGRWDVYGKELVRLKDRHERDCVLGPTHEEVITTIAKNELRSYRKLPANLYQIQNKYRDEIRPRFGLLRGREFIMKDAYSFHTSQEDLEREYQVMAEAYTRIFERCGLKTKMVRSDSGAIGGSVSHEFMVLTKIAEGEQESGENEVFYCDDCGYAANGERAESVLTETNLTGKATEAKTIDTPNATSIEILEKQFGFEPSLILKSLIYIKDETEPVMALIRGDKDINEIKLKNVLGANTLRLATDEEVAKVSGGSSKGFIGPVGLPQPVRIVADASVKDLKNFYIAANQKDKHVVGANWQTDVPLPAEWYDIRQVKVGEQCPSCSTPLKMTRGIEVGNIFDLGTKYSEAMSATYTAEDGTEKHFIMGCYGIGISRTAAAAVEGYHDQWGIVWPMAIAPYQAIVIIVNTEDATQQALATQTYEALRNAGVEVVLDDRDERAGVKFKDADLIGFPIKITAGKLAADGKLEVKLRDGSFSGDLPAAEVLGFVQQQIETWQPFKHTEAVPV